MTDCAHMCVRACVHACVRACVRVCACMSKCVKSFWDFSCFFTSIEFTFKFSLNSFLIEIFQIIYFQLLINEKSVTCLST